MCAITDVYCVYIQDAAQQSQPVLPAGEVRPAPFPILLSTQAPLATTECGHGQGSQR